MARTRVQFRDEVRQRLGWSATDIFAVDSELNNYINEALEELHALLVTVHRPGTFGIATAGFVVLAGTNHADVGLFGDFGRLLRVTIQYADRLVPLPPGDRITDATDLIPIAWTPYNVRYYLSIEDGSGITSQTRIVFDRYTLGAQNVLIDYIKSPPVLANDTDVSWLGWDEYVLLDVMLKCRDKEDDDGAALVQKKAQLEQRIRNHAEPVDMGHAATVVDVRALDYYHDDFDRGWWRRWA